MKAAGPEYDSGPAFVVAADVVLVGCVEDGYRYPIKAEILGHVRTESYLHLEIVVVQLRPGPRVSPLVVVGAQGCGMVSRRGVRAGLRCGPGSAVVPRELDLDLGVVASCADVPLRTDLYSLDCGAAGNVVRKVVVPVDLVCGCDSGRLSVDVVAAEGVVRIGEVADSLTSTGSRRRCGGVLRDTSFGPMTTGARTSLLWSASAHSSYWSMSIDVDVAGVDFDIEGH